MVVFGTEEALGLLSLTVLIAAAGLIARGLLKQRGGISPAHIRETLDDFEEREEINRLRHRDFPAFLERLNERRRSLGQPPLTREYLEPHQYNLMYSVDAGDIDETELEKLRKRVGKAAKVGDGPAEAPQVG